MHEALYIRFAVTSFSSIQAVKITDHLYANAWGLTDINTGKDSYKKGGRGFEFSQHTQHDMPWKLMSMHPLPNDA